MKQSKKWYAMRDAMEAAGIVLDQDGGGLYGEWNGRKVRVIETAMLFEVGDKDFDRWANSVLGCFHINPNRFGKQLAKYGDEWGLI